MAVVAGCGQAVMITLDPAITSPIALIRQRLAKTNQRRGMAQASLSVSVLLCNNVGDLIRGCNWRVGFGLLVHALTALGTCLRG